jgi:hypothetical protein
MIIILDCLGSVGNLGRMLQKRQQNLALHGGRLEKKSYGIVQEGSQEDKNIDTFTIH